MSIAQVFNDTDDLKAKFRSCFLHKKKIRALENYSSVAPFRHNQYLDLIKGILSCGFLDQEEDQFLSHMLNKYEVNFLDWSYKTKWLKQEMVRIYNYHNPPTMTQGDLFSGQKLSLTPGSMIPLDLLKPFDFVNKSYKKYGT